MVLRVLFRLTNGSDELKAIWNDTVIAQSDNTVVVEGNHYFPIDTVNPDYLLESNYTSWCGWKGTASYFSLVVDGQTNTNAAWYYSDPKEAANEIRGRVAFWHGVEVIT